MKNQALNDLLRQWLRGETRRNEDSRLERSAQQDPFLSDAWEGYNQDPQLDHLRQLEHLSAKIVARAQAQKNRAPILVWLPRMAAAAAVLLLIGFGWKWLFNPNPQAELAVQVPALETESTAKNTPAEALPKVADVQTESAEKATQPAGRKKADQGPGAIADNWSAEAIQSDDASKEIASPLVIDKAEGVQPEEKAKLNADLEETTNSKVANSPRSKDATKPAAPRDLLPQPVPTVGGIVLDEQGQLARGVPVQKNANTFAITNQDGAFEFPSTAPAQVQVISSDDFESRSLRLDDNNQKVVVQRKTLAKKKSFEASDRRDGVGYPSPEGGFGKFEKYIVDNLETPYEAKRNSISGDVTLEFTFEKDGTPARISVLRSLGFGCDQAAEYLIENGPKWRNVKPGVWVIYKVVFK